LNATYSQFVREHGSLSILPVQEINLKACALDELYQIRVELRSV